MMFLLVAHFFLIQNIFFVQKKDKLTSLVGIKWECRITDSCINIYQFPINTENRIRKKTGDNKRTHAGIGKNKRKIPDKYLE